MYYYKGKLNNRVVAREMDKVKGRVFLKMGIITSCLFDFERDEMFARATS